MPHKDCLHQNLHQNAPSIRNGALATTFLSNKEKIRELTRIPHVSLECP